MDKRLENYVDVPHRIKLFYEKYPESFPKDYKQQSASMKSMIDKITNINQKTNN